MAQYWSEIISAVAALVGVVVGGVIQHVSVQKQFRDQQNWAARQAHYMKLLGHLAKARVSVEDLCGYYEEPNSEYRDFGKNPNYLHLSRILAGELAALRELSGPAQVFLPSEAIDSLLELELDAGNAFLDAVHNGEYFEVVDKVVKRAEQAVLKAAQADLLAQPVRT